MDTLSFNPNLTAEPMPKELMQLSVYQIGLFKEFLSSSLSVTNKCWSCSYPRTRLCYQCLSSSSGSFFSLLSLDGISLSSNLGSSETHRMDVKGSHFHSFLGCFPIPRVLMFTIIILCYNLQKLFILFSYFLLNLFFFSLIIFYLNLIYLQLFSFLIPRFPYFSSS